MTGRRVQLPFKGVNEELIIRHRLFFFLVKVQDRNWKPPTRIFNEVELAIRNFDKTLDNAMAIVCFSIFILLS